LPTGGACGDPRFLVELAERAEATGWDGLFLEDYVSAARGSRRARRSRLRASVERGPLRA
jgi:hypothetical protein